MQAAAIAFFCKTYFDKDPCAKFVVRRALEGWGRLCLSRPPNRRPISFELLRKMRKKLRVVCWSDYEARLFSAAFSIAFFGALRVGELVVEVHGDGRTRGLLLQDVQLSSAEVGITIRHSKTDQRGKGALIRLPATGVTGPCPVKDVNRYLVVRAQGDGPLFRHENGSPLTRHQFAGVMRLSAVRIWMVGHSIVHWAGVAARQSGLGPGLGLPSHVRVSWLSRRGMRWSEFLPRIRRQLLLEGPPEAIVVQLGENDLVAMDCLSLRAAILADLEALRAMVPTAKLFWSKLLQRRVWLGSRCPAATERARKRINAAVSKRIVELGGEVIFHQEISYPAAALFRADGVHLSASGNEVWLGAVVAKLRSWLGL
ncbi:uncharacterized protein LOC144325689 [Podarcis muralis]